MKKEAGDELWRGMVGSKMKFYGPRVLLCCQGIEPFFSFLEVSGKDCNPLSILEPPVGIRVLQFSTQKPWRDRNVLLSYLT